MPTVPTYGGQQVGQTSNSGGRFTAPQMHNDQAGRMQRQGAELANTGAALTAIGADMAQQVNQVRVDGELNKVRQKILHNTYDQTDGYQNLKGAAALERPDGLALADEYGAKLKTYVSELSGTLGNDAQRRVFEQHAASLMQQHSANIQQHTNQEYKNHALSVQDGTIKISSDEARLNWQDPAKINSSLESVKAAVYRTAGLQGWSANETTARMKQMTSTVHMGVLESAMQENDPEYAMDYMTRFKEDMTADDLLKVRAVITKDVQQRVAVGIAGNVVQAARRAADPSDIGRMAAITAQSESGNRERTAAGGLVTSVKGAQGAMQVMPGTNRDPGYGVTAARDDSDAERTRVGRDYLQAMVKNYAGDPAKAWAAYNWGPGKVDEAIKEHGANWLDHAPAETRAYVVKNMAALGSGAGAARPTLQDIHDQVRAQTAGQPPAVQKLALTEATQQFGDMERARKAQEDEAVTNAMREIQSVGGHFSRLPYAVRSTIPPDKIDTVINFGQKIAKGDDITNPAVYQRLSDPKVLTRLTDDQFFQLRGELSQSDWQQLAGQRATAQGKPGNTLESINMDAMNSAMKDTLASLQIDPSPKDGTAEAAQLGTVKLFVKDSILKRQQATGKVMTDAEVESHIRSLYAKSTTFRTSVMGIGTGTSPERLLTMKAGDIPDATREALTKDFAAAGVAAPSDADLLGAYLRLKQRPQKPRPSQTFSGKITPMKG
jgi:soluble lytic murein transglycosylase